MKNRKNLKNKKNMKRRSLYLKLGALGFMGFLLGGPPRAHAFFDKIESALKEAKFSKAKEYIKKRKEKGKAIDEVKILNLTFNNPRMKSLSEKAKKHFEKYGPIGGNAANLDANLDKLEKILSEIKKLEKESYDFIMDLDRAGYLPLDPNLCMNNKYGDAGIRKKIAQYAVTIGDLEGFRRIVQDPQFGSQEPRVRFNCFESGNAYILKDFYTGGRFSDNQYSAFKRVLSMKYPYLLRNSEEDTCSTPLSSSSSGSSDYFSFPKEYLSLGQKFEEDMAKVK